MTGIDIFGGLFGALRRHFRWIGTTRHPSRAELPALDIIFALVGLDSIYRTLFSHDLISLLVQILSLRTVLFPRRTSR
jgi:hypothetical protein